MIVVGVDAGGTSTRALAWDDTVRVVVGVGRSGPGNPNSTGHDLARQNVLRAVLDAVGDRADEVTRLAVTMAGGSATGGALDGLAAAAAAAGLACPIDIEPDLLGAWFSGCSEEQGVVLIAGTGAVAATIVGGRINRLVDGAGWLLGDDGAGFWIGRRAVHDVLAAIDGRGPDTALTDLVLARTPQLASHRDRPGDPRRVALIEHCYGLRPVQLAGFAPLVVQSVGDPVADRILADAADLIESTARAALVGVHESSPVVLAGSVAGLDSVIRDRLVSLLGDRARLASDGVVGATMVALRAAGRPADEATRVAMGVPPERVQGQP
ncbi:N-acetylglucosamine kinase [Aestuariimicrobium kwangyangense]|uniref:N-acetylglucosamine kinase n=1 Tax=Aestuariimicrobium kwangyangense TaxID=396389 RepID=UPI0003B44D7B|nr:BadF/BadG/BcrA/BcrD ATPase family protein [Aestuariimicrobium kwangyangense]